MLKKEKFLIAEFDRVWLRRQDAVRLRGFFADLDREESLLHNHTGEGSSIYRYPSVQYKVLRHRPVVVAFGQGIAALYPRLMEADAITLGDSTFETAQVNIRLESREIGDSPTPCHYRFATPWLALNQANYRQYRQLEDAGARQQLLQRVLVGNILSMCRGFDVQLEGRLQLQASLQEVPVRFKGQSMLGFTGTFTVNARLPALCGLGKGVSRGMGTVLPAPPPDQT